MMIKFTAPLSEGTIYGFAFTDANLNRLEFNREPIFFDFGYAGHPETFGLIMYFDGYNLPEEILQDIDVIKQFCVPYFDGEDGVTPETLRFFPIARSIMQKFRSTPFWGYETLIKIAHPKDKQWFFAARDERAIQEYFQAGGVAVSRVKRQPKGFGGDR